MKLVPRDRVKADMLAWMWPVRTKREQPISVWMR
jgi:hypothetical protein